MKSLIAFTQEVLHDMEDWCHISTARDQKTITSRVEHEGLSFLTISLPGFGKDLQKGLSRGWVAHDLFSGFHWTGGLPTFLSGFLELVFDRSTGLLLEVPSTDAIRAVHQLTSMFGKIELPCSKEREKLAVERYLKCENEVRLADAARTPELAQMFTSASKSLFARIFTQIDLTVYSGELIPKHGPGATADHLKGNRKWNQRQWPSRLEEYFPMGEFLLPNWGWYHSLDDCEIVEPGAEMPVRVVFVPKTLKTPRVIAIEPTCMQYCQQALLAEIVEGVEQDDFLSPFIGFTDQLPNRQMARDGSLSGELATLDLSDASDRVSNQHVRLLLAQHPHFAGAVEACRSRKADVFGDIVRLAKFASMGSALCFPMEAMVFLTIIFAAIGQELNRPVTRELISEFVGKVRVYGDDIIVPVEMMEPVATLLEAFGLKVNSGKSFGTGQFRESCGGDYFSGTWITPVRVRNMLPQQLKQTDEVISTVSLRNQLWETEMFPRSVAWLDSFLGRLLPVYPEVFPSSSVLGRHSLNPVAEKMSKTLHIPVVKGCVVKSILPASKLDGMGALVKFFMKPGSSEQPKYADKYRAIGPASQDRDHLSFAGRPVSVDIKTRWTSMR